MWSVQRLIRIALGMAGANNVALAAQDADIVVGPVALQHRCRQFVQLGADHLKLALGLGQLLPQGVALGTECSELLTRELPREGNIDTAVRAIPHVKTSADRAPASSRIEAASRTFLPSCAAGRR